MNVDNGKPLLLVLPSDDEVLIQGGQLSRYIAIAPQTLARWRTQKIGPPYIKSGRLVLYRTGDVRKWLKSRIVETASWSL